MKKLVVVLALSSVIFACSKPSSQTETTSVPEATAPTGLGNSVWVNARYLQTIEETKSPLKAKIYADTVMVSFNAAADTANMVWNFHEGSSYAVKQGDSIQLFNTYEQKPTPEFAGSLINNTLTLGKTAFKRVEGIDFIEQKFWIGKYTTNGKPIELKANNELTGMESADSYHVWVDYVTTQTDIDLIDLGKQGTDNSKTYGYKFEGNDIVFYEFIWAEDGLIGKAGKEVFRWKKQ